MLIHMFGTLRKSICELGDASAMSGRPMPITQAKQPAANWMVANNVADYNDAGQLVLRSSSLVFRTVLTQPEKAQEPLNTSNRSLWSLRRGLQGLGWTAAETARGASVMEKLFNKSNNSTVYLAILIDRRFGFDRAMS